MGSRRAVALVPALAALVLAAAADGKSIRMPLSLSLDENDVLRICVCDDRSNVAEVSLNAVRVEDAAAPSSAPLWALHAGTKEPQPVSCFRYGEEAGELDVTTEPADLEVGPTYRLAVMASGRHAQTFFRFTTVEGKRVLEVFDEMPTR